MTQKNEPKYFIMPRVLFYLKDLTIMEKFLLSEIYHLDNKDGCYASNKHFVDTLKIKIGSVTNMLTSLRKKGLIEYDDTKEKRTLHATETAKLLFGDLHWLMEGASIAGWRDLHRLMEGNNTFNSTLKKDTCSSVKEKGPNLLRGLTKEKEEMVMDVYDFWNSYKGEGFHSHNKLTHDMVLAIIGNLKYYTVEDMCIAITNYVTVITDETCLLSHKWPLTTFFTVGKDSSKNSPRKWWRFLPENFSIDNHRRKQNTEVGNVPVEVRERIPTPLEDPDPDLTNEIIQKYCQLIGTSTENYNLTTDRHNKFIQTTILLTKFFSRGKEGRIPKSTWVDYLMQCMQTHRLDKGEIVHPGHLCSLKGTWDTLMPQHLKDLGRWYE